MMGRMASPDRRSPDRRMGSPDPHPLVLPMPPPSPKLRSPGSQARSPEGRSPGRLQAEGPSFEHGREPQAWSMSGGTPSLGPQEYPTRNSRTSSQTPEAGPYGQPPGFGPSGPNEPPLLGSTSTFLTQSPPPTSDTSLPHKRK